MIEIARPNKPPAPSRRPGLGASRLRGLETLARMFRAYRGSKYLPLYEIKGKDWQDLANAIEYIWILVGWKIDADKRKKDDQELDRPSG